MARTLSTYLYDKITGKPQRFRTAECFRVDTGASVGTAISDANGKVTFTGLLAGVQYRITSKQPGNIQTYDERESTSGAITQYNVKNWGALGTGGNIAQTTVDANSASGQKVLNVASTTGFVVGDLVVIQSNFLQTAYDVVARYEYNTIASIQDGVSLTLSTNLTYTHTAAQADGVMDIGPDDTAAVVACFAAAAADQELIYHPLSPTSAQICFLDGQFNVTTTLVMAQGLMVVGTGKNATIINNVANGSCFVVDSTKTQAARRITFRDLQIRGIPRDVATTGSAISVSATTGNLSGNCSVQNVWIYGGFHGITFNNCYAVTDFNNVRVDYIGGDGFRTGVPDPTVEGYSTGVTLMACYANQCYGHGFNLVASYPMLANCCANNCGKWTWSGSDKTGVLTYSDGFHFAKVDASYSTQVAMIGCNAEVNSGRAIYGDYIREASFNSCLFAPGVNLYNGTHAIELNHGRNVTLFSCMVVATDGYGLYMHDTTQGIVVVNSSISGSLSKAFWFNDTASGVGAYYKAMDTVQTGAESLFTTSGMGAGNDQLLTSWIAPTAQPNSLVVPAGSQSVHIHAERTAGDRTVVLYWTLSERKEDTSETVICTSAVSGAVTSKSDFTMAATLASAYTMAATTLTGNSRLVVKVYANVSGGSTATSVTLYAEGTTNSRVTLVGYANYSDPTICTFIGGAVHTTGQIGIGAEPSAAGPELSVYGMVGVNDTPETLGQIWAASAGTGAIRATRLSAVTNQSLAAIYSGHKTSASSMTDAFGARYCWTLEHATSGPITAATIDAIRNGADTTAKMELCIRLADVLTTRATLDGTGAQFAGILQGSQLKSTVAVGTAPLIVTSTTMVSNLNADLLDGLHASSFLSGTATDAYTQTYDLTERTVTNLTTASILDIADLTATLWNQMVDDVRTNRKLINSLIDDHQAWGICE